MSDTPALTEDQYEPGPYEIRVRGHLDDRWADWFETVSITREDGGDTRLTSSPVDQAALYALLRKVRDLGLTLIAVSQLERRPLDMSEVAQEIVQKKRCKDDTR